MDGSDEHISRFGVQDMTASPILKADDFASPSLSVPSSPSLPAEALPEALLPAERAELLRLRQEVAHLRSRLTTASEPCERERPGPVETSVTPFETPDKDRRSDSSPGFSESGECGDHQIAISEVRRRSDWALRERAYRCARDAFMGPDGVMGAGRVVRSQLLATMRQEEPDVAAFFESPRQQFRCLMVEGDPEGIIEWDDFVNCYVRQCKQSISAAKAMEPERERSPATASTRSPVLPLQRCSEIGRNGTCLSEDVSPSRMQEIC